VQWLVMFALTVLVIARFQRERLRHTALRSAIILALFLSGCGGSGAHISDTPAGTYQLTVTATSGSMAQNATLTLVVK